MDFWTSDDRDESLYAFELFLLLLGGGGSSFRVRYAGESGGSDVLGLELTGNGVIQRYHRHRMNERNDKNWLECC